MNSSKFDTLMELEGYDDFEEFLTVLSDSVNPGICINVGCDYTTNVEPDCDSGWCEECNTNTVVSGTYLVF